MTKKIYNENKTVSVVGLGKIGLCFAACLADRGFDTIGVDIDDKVVAKVNNKCSPFYEPGLSNLLTKIGGTKFHATSDYSQAIIKTDITFVIVGTPTDDDVNFSNHQIISSLTSLAITLRETDKLNHLFVISSTVTPGSIKRDFIPLIEDITGRKSDVGFDMCYNPDFVALGNVIHGFSNPEIVVIGENRPDAGKLVEDLHRRLCLNEPDISHMSLASAELAKVSLNAYITLKISFANLLADFCEQVPEADLDTITRAIGNDRRISPYYFTGGLPYGGTCFPRDTKAFIAFADQLGIDSGLIHAVERINLSRRKRLCETVIDELDKAGCQTAGIIGLSFKPDTSVITESPGIHLIEYLLARDYEVFAFDPHSSGQVRDRFGDRVQLSSSPEEGLSKAGVNVLMHRDERFKHLIESYRPGSKLIIIDCWRFIDAAVTDDLISIVPFGYYRD